MTINHIAHHLYVITRLSRWPRGVAYVDGRTVGRGRHRRRAVGRNRGLERRRGHGLRRRTDGRAGTSKAGQTDGQADGLADRPKWSFWLVWITSHEHISHYTNVGVRVLVVRRYIHCYCSLGCDVILTSVWREGAGVGDQMAERKTLPACTERTRSTF